MIPQNRNTKKALERQKELYLRHCQGSPFDHQTTKMESMLSEIIQYNSKNIEHNN